jgi:hypothetical protein
MEDVAFRSVSEADEVGETPEPVTIIRNYCGDLGLLEHELGDEDGVGIGGLAPGKIAGVLAEPGEERAPEWRGRWSRVHADKETSNVQRPTSNVE